MHVCVFDKRFLLNLINFDPFIVVEPLELTHHERDGPDEQLYTEQDWSPCQDYKDSDPPQVKVETSSSPQGDTDHCYESVYDEPRSSSPSHDQTLSIKTFYTSEEKRREDEGLGRVSQPFLSVDLDHPAAQSENTEGVLNGGWMKALKTQKPRLNNNSRSKKRDVSRERRHTCPICAKRFKESGHLKDHVRIHTGEKPYRCKECGVNFRQSGTLTLHMRIHTGERPYQCTDCGRRFNRKGDMETHRLTHTGERPHQCLVCGKSFKRKGNLNTHLKTHPEFRVDYTQPL